MPSRPTARSSAAFAVVAALAVACAPTTFRTGATVKPDDLPSDPAELVTLADGWFAKADPVAWENSLVALDRAMAVEPNPFKPAWRAARAAFWLANVSDSSEVRREHFANAGANYARAAIGGDEKRVEGHYYLALNLGYVASTKTVVALEILPEMAKSGRRAAELDERIDHAGPHRLLGMIYLRAPSWPTSVGDIDESLDQLRRAVELSPDYPPNHLHLAQALAADDKTDEAAKELDAALKTPAPSDVTWKLEQPGFAKEAAELQRKLGGGAPAATAK